MLVEQPDTQKKDAQVSPTTEPVRKSKLRGLLLVLLVAAAVIGYVIYHGLTSRARANTTLERETTAGAIETVATVKPKPAGAAEEVILPGNMQAFTDTPIWARASGYLRVWHVDIGARVRRGQLLAEIEAPEIDQQLQQAKANLTVAQANLKLSRITAERYSDLFKTDSVAKQDVDNVVQDAEAKSANVTAVQANVSRLEQLVQYESVFAPFEGVITVRNVDVGALVNADTNTPGKELFHLASNTTLRVYVNVPEAYSRAAIPGVTSYLTLAEFPGRQFRGTIARNAKSIDVSSRTLLVEVDVKNPGGLLLPGSYASVHLKLPSKVQALTVPSNVLLFRAEGLQIAKVQNNHVQLSKVILGRDQGDTVEILSGLSPNDAVIVNPSDSIAAGQQVQVNRQKSAGAE